MAPEQAEPRFKFLGGHIALDFFNTVDWRISDEPSERLQRYEDLVAWGRQAGVLTPELARRLLATAREEPARAEETLKEAQALREAMGRVIWAAAKGKPPGAPDLTALNAALARALAHARVEHTGERLTWSWTVTADDLDCMVWPVVRAAAELITSDAIHQVKMCADDRCGWLFLDTTRNRRRRWCSMEDCGNRNKVRRYYARKKASGRQPT